MQPFCFLRNCRNKTPLQHCGADARDEKVQMHIFITAACSELFTSLSKLAHTHFKVPMCRHYVELHSNMHPLGPRRHPDPSIFVVYILAFEGKSLLLSPHKVVRNVSVVELSCVKPSMRAGADATGASVVRLITRARSP